MVSMAVRGLVIKQDERSQASGIQRGLLNLLPWFPAADSSIVHLIRLDWRIV